MTYVCHATWIAEPESAALVAAALAELTVHARAEPGCRFYQPCVDPEDPATFHIFEIYDDGDAFAAHLDASHTLEFALRRAIPLLTSRSRAVYATLESTDPPSGAY